MVDTYTPLKRLIIEIPILDLTTTQKQLQIVSMPFERNKYKANCISCTCYGTNSDWNTSPGCYSTNLDCYSPNPELLRCVLRSFGFPMRSERERGIWVSCLWCFESPT